MRATIGDFNGKKKSTASGARSAGKFLSCFQPRGEKREGRPGARVEHTRNGGSPHDRTNRPHPRRTGGEQVISFGKRWVAYE